MNEVREFYDAQAQYEWDRLGRHRMEFALSMRLLVNAQAVRRRRALREP